MLVMGLFMARIPKRWDGSGHWYFVTVVTLLRQPVFADERACKVLQSAFHEVHHYHPFRLAALVMLPDHWHALIRPGVRNTNEVGTQPAETQPSAETQPPAGAQPAGAQPRPTRIRCDIRNVDEVGTQLPVGAQPRPTRIRCDIRNVDEAETQLPAGAQPRPTKVVIEEVVGAVKKNVLRDLQMKRSTIWQARFLDHRIRDEDDFLHHLEYIRFNPLKHGYVTEPDQYEWCFIHNRPFG